MFYCTADNEFEIRNLEFSDFVQKGSVCFSVPLDLFSECSLCCYLYETKGYLEFYYLELAVKFNNNVG